MVIRSYRKSIVSRPIHDERGLCSDWPRTLVASARPSG